MNSESIPIKATYIKITDKYNTGTRPGGGEPGQKDARMDGPGRTERRQDSQTSPWNRGDAGP